MLIICNFWMISVFSVWALVQADGKYAEFIKTRLIPSVSLSLMFNDNFFCESSLILYLFFQHIPHS